MLDEISGRSSVPSCPEPVVGRRRPAFGASSRIRILLIDHGEPDTQLYVRGFDRAQFEVVRRPAGSAQELAERCFERVYDAIVCDASMHAGMSLEALELIRQRNPALPFILLINPPDLVDGPQQDLFTEFMLRGATDCVDTHHPRMLSAAVAFAVEERLLIEERNQIDRQLERARARYQAVADTEDASNRTIATEPVRMAWVR